MRSLPIVAVLVAACAGHESPPAPPPPTLTVDVGLELPVLVDGEPRGTTPLRDAELGAGAHEVVVKTPCGTHTASVDMHAGSTVLDAAAFDGLGSAVLRIEATAVDGRALKPRVELGGQPVLARADGSYIAAACRQRLRISTETGETEGLGAFEEDLELQAGQTVPRKVVLAPGPEMVRIAGGPFTMGPTLRQRKEAQLYVSEPNVDTRVAAFDLDRTEVTAADFVACATAGGCEFDLAKVPGLRMPRKVDIPRCTFWREIVKNKLIPEVIDGRGAHPVNCVTKWEAQAYCAWAGKRLPSADEWEFAARSGTSTYEYPWGSDRPAKCPIHGYDGEMDCNGYEQTAPVCSQPDGNSEQGLCDLLGNVCEYVDAEHDGVGHRCKGGNYGESVPAYALWPVSENSKEPTVGFRCARSVGP